MSSGTRKNAIRAVTILSLILLVAGTQLVSSANASTLNVQRRYSFLKASGTSIVDSAGNAVLLRGANFFGYEYGLWDIHTESDYKKMASWGFNAVRLPIAWNFIEPQPGKYDESYLSKHVDKDIAWAAKNGLYVILDMHQYDWSPYFTYHDSWHTAGVPSWAVSGYPNTAEGQAHARADFWNNLGPNGTPASDANPSMQDRFALMWKYVASRYVAQSVVAAYDLLNEPTAYSSDSKFCFYDVDKFSSEALPAFYAKVTDTIRTVDSNHMLLWEPDWGTHSSSTAALRRPNVAYAPHYPGMYGEYWHGPDSSSTDMYDGNKSTLSESVGKIVQFAAKYDQPVVIGEWGIRAEGANAAQYIRDLGDVMHAYGVSWTWWSYGRCDFGMNLLDETGSERTILVNNLLWVMTI